MNDDEILAWLYKWNDRFDGQPTFPNIYRDVRVISRNGGRPLTEQLTREALQRLERQRRIVRDGDTWRAIPTKLHQPGELQKALF